MLPAPIHRWRKRGRKDKGRRKEDPKIHKHSVLATKSSLFPRLDTVVFKNGLLTARHKEDFPSYTQYWKFQEKLPSNPVLNTLPENVPAATGSPFPAPLSRQTVFLFKKESTRTTPNCTKVHCSGNKNKGSNQEHIIPEGESPARKPRKTGWETPKRAVAFCHPGDTLCFLTISLFLITRIHKGEDCQRDMHIK